LEPESARRSHLNPQDAAPRIRRHTHKTLTRKTESFGKIARFWISLWRWRGFCVDNSFPPALFWSFVGYSTPRFREKDSCGHTRPQICDLLHNHIFRRAPIRQAARYSRYLEELTKPFLAPGIFESPSRGYL